MTNSIRENYDKYGADNYYKEHSENYSNPHYETIKKIMNKIIKEYNLGENICDLCCGSGEVTKLIKDSNIIGVDPYLNKLYEKTGHSCLSYSFKDIVEGKMKDYNFDTIICSFALHLCEESMLPTLLYQLKEISNKLIVISPHKRPDCDGMFWTLDKEIKIDRVTAKIYK